MNHENTKWNKKSESKPQSNNRLKDNYDDILGKDHVNFQVYSEYF